MIRMVAASLAAFFLTLGSAAAFASPAGSSATADTVTPARTALARELVGYTQPKELMIEAVMHGWELGVSEQSAAEFDRLDEIQPGLGARLTERGKSELVNLVAVRIPQMQDKLAKLYADNCTEAELKEMIAFYSSATGRKLIRSVTMADKGGDAFDDEKVTAAEATKANREAAKDAVATLDGDEWIEALKFGVSPGGRIVKKLTPQVQAISAEWMTLLLADFGKRMEPITEEMVMQAIEQADKKASTD